MRNKRPTTRELEMPPAYAADPVHLFQIALAHHSPQIRAVREPERHSLANDGNVTIIGISRKFHKKVAAVAYGIGDARVQLSGSRIGEYQLQLSMLLHADNAPFGRHTVLQVFAVGKRAVLEPASGQRRTRRDVLIQLGFAINM